MSRHPETITTGEQFDATQFEVGVIYDDGDAPGEISRHEYVGDGSWVRSKMGEYPDGPRSRTGFPRLSLPLTLVSEPELPTFKPGDRVEYVNPDWSPLLGKLGTVDERDIRSDRVPVTWDDAGATGMSGEPAEHLRLVIVKPDPAPVEPTDEQRAAWLRLSNSPDAPAHVGRSVEDDAALIAPLLPDTLTNPQPVLPIDKGLYVDQRGLGGSVWRIERDGDPMHREGGSDQPAPDLGPFTRLVPERPLVTAEQVRRCTRGNLLRPAEVVALVKLANGTPDE